MRSAALGDTAPGRNKRRDSVVPHAKLWSENFELLRQHVIDHGHAAPVINSDPLGKWARRQRVAFKKGRLSKERADKLRSIGFFFDEAQAKWLRKLEELRRYTLKHGRAAPRRAEGGLGKWVARQQAEHRQGRLPEERAQMLAGVGVRFGHTNKEEGQSARLATFEQLCPVTLQQQDTAREAPVQCTPALGTWMCRQRAALEQRSLTPERRLPLSSVAVSVDGGTTNTSRDSPGKTSARRTGRSSAAEMPGRGSESRAPVDISRPGCGRGGTGDTGQWLHDEVVAVHDEVVAADTRGVADVAEYARARASAGARVEQRGEEGSDARRSWQQCAQGSASMLEGLRMRETDISMPESEGQRGHGEQQGYLAYLLQQMKQAEAAVEYAAGVLVEQQECLRVKVALSDTIALQRRTCAFAAAHEAARMLHKARCLRASANLAAARVRAHAPTPRDAMLLRICPHAVRADEQLFQGQICGREGVAGERVPEAGELDVLVGLAVLNASEADTLAAAAEAAAVHAASIKMQHERLLQQDVEEAEERATSATRKWWDAVLRSRRLAFVSPDMPDHQPVASGLRTDAEPRRVGLGVRSASPSSCSSGSSHAHLLGSAVTSEGKHPGSLEEAEHAGGGRESARCRPPWLNEGRGSGGAVLLAASSATCDQESASSLSGCESAGAASASGLDQAAALGCDDASAPGSMPKLAAASQGGRRLAPAGVVDEPIVGGTLPDATADAAIRRSPRLHPANAGGGDVSVQRMWWSCAGRPKRNAVAGKELDLPALMAKVDAMGGAVSITAKRQWRVCDPPPPAAAAPTRKQQARTHALKLPCSSAAEGTCLLLGVSWRFVRGVGGVREIWRGQVVAKELGVPLTKSTQQRGIGKRLSMLYSRALQVYC